jgi:hypothetical protein
MSERPSHDRVSRILDKLTEAKVDQYIAVKQNEKVNMSLADTGTKLDKLTRNVIATSYGAQKEETSVLKEYKPKHE